MDRFCYQENELHIADSLCDLCAFQIEGVSDRCKKFEKKPDTVMDNSAVCPEYKGKILIEL